MDVKKDIVFRLSTIYIIAAVIAFAIVVRIIQLQFVQYKEYEPTAENAQFRTDTTHPERGDICTHDGKILATSQPFYDIRVDFATEALLALPTDTFDKYLRQLSDSLVKVLPDKTHEEILGGLLTAKAKKKRYYLIKKDVDYQEKKRMSKFPLFNRGQFRGGFRAVKKSERIRPYGNLAARTIGSLRHGKYIGIEGYFNSELKGREQIKLLKRIGDNWIPITTEEPFQPLSGKDIITTIDIDFQDFAHHALLEQLKKENADTGVVILMEVKTGEIKAIVNLMRSSDSSYYEGYNHAIGSAIEPGSTFKLASMIVGLEDGFFKPDSSIQTGNGYLKIDDFQIKEASGHGYGLITTQQVLEKSSNVGTALLVSHAYMKEPKNFVNRLYSMDLDKKVGIEIRGEPLPSIKYPGDPLWSGVSLPQMSIGYEVLLTPLQILNFYNAVANDGVMVKPTIIKAIREHGKITKKFKPQITNPSICSKPTINKVKSMLKGVVEHGTADCINGTPYKIAGKTGTAQVATGKAGYKKRIYYGSFAGYFPADNPKYSCIVVVKTSDKHRYYGSILAAPVFKKIADKVYASSASLRRNLEQNGNSSISKNAPKSKDGNIKDLDLIYNKLRIPVKGRDKVRSAWIVTRESNQVVKYQNRFVSRTKVPLVVGMGLKDAIYLMESVGLKVVVEGSGQVKKQSIEAGRHVVKNRTIVLTLG